MKIGVFGDSFADEFNMFRTDNMSWANQLRNFGYDITNHGKCASSLYFSYRQLLEHHSNYDKVIFLITGSGRFYLDHLPEKLRHVAHGRVNYLRAENPNGENREIIVALEHYYTYLQNYNFENTIHQLLIKECKAVRPDALFISCFPQYAEGFNLNMVSEHDIVELKKNYDTENFIINDKRFCHMNDNNNLLVAKKIKTWLEGGSFHIDEAEFLPSTLPLLEILALESPRI